VKQATEVYETAFFVRFKKEKRSKRKENRVLQWLRE
jgi:hypothetical protein